MRMRMRTPVARPPRVPATLAVAAGFGLVELMIAMTLGLLLSAAVLQIALASKNSYRVVEASSRLQESGRFAMSHLARDLRSAGYMGCPSLQRSVVNVIAKDPPADIDFTPAGVLVGQDNVAAGNGYSAVAGSDVIVIQRAAVPGARLTGNMTADNANIQIDGNPNGLVQRDYVFVTDCIDADLFRATSVSANQSDSRVTLAHANNLNTTNRLSKAYGPDAEVFGFQSLAYFVRDTGRRTAGGKPIHALWVQARRLGSGGAAPVAYELVEGVENMQLSYGEDSDGDRSIDVYRSAADVSDWAAVLSVRIELLLHSLEDNVVGASGEFVQSNLSFNGAAVASDGRLRQVYSSAVAVRNRLP